MKNIRFDTISELGGKGRVYNDVLMVHGYNAGFGGILTMFANITKLIKLNFQTIDDRAIRNFNLEELSYSENDVKALATGQLTRDFWQQSLTVTKTS